MNDKDKNPRRIQFEATAAMAQAIDNVVDASARAGVKLTASHVCRIAVADYLARIGYMDRPETAFANMIGTVAANG